MTLALKRRIFNILRFLPHKYHHLISRKIRIKKEIFIYFLYLKQINEQEDLEIERDYYENEEFNYLYYY